MDHDCRVNLFSIHKSKATFHVERRFALFGNKRAEIPQASAGCNPCPPEAFPSKADNPNDPPTDKHIRHPELVSGSLILSVLSS